MLNKDGILIQRKFCYLTCRNSVNEIRYLGTKLTDQCFPYSCHINEIFTDETVRILNTNLVAEDFKLKNAYLFMEFENLLLVNHALFQLSNHAKEVIIRAIKSDYIAISEDVGVSNPTVCSFQLPLASTCEVLNKQILKGCC